MVMTGRSPACDDRGFAIFTAILRASSLLSNLAADCRPGLLLEIDISELLAVAVADNKAGGLFLNGPRCSDYGFRNLAV